MSVASTVELLGPSNVLAYLRNRAFAQAALPGFVGDAK
jgi:hypothetical protein